MNGISELLQRYGTSLAETRALMPELTEAIRRRRKPAIPTAPQFFTAGEAREFGVEIDPDWMLKVTPGKDGEEPILSLISPKGEDVGLDVFETEAGKWITRAEKESFEAQREVELGRWEEAVTPVFPELFPEFAEAFAELTPEMTRRYIPEIMEWAFEEPEAFLERMATVGRTEETEALLRLMGAEEEYIDELFKTITPMYITPEGRLIYTEAELFEYYAEAYRAPEYAEIPDWAKVFAAGAGDLMVTAGGAARWLGQDGIGESLTKQGQALQPLAYDIPTQANWDTLFSPRFYAFRPAPEHGYQVLRALPFTISLLPAAVAGVYAGLGTAAAVGLGTLGKLILATFGASIMAAPMEAALEAGQTFDEAQDKGLSVEEAKVAADSVFKKNVMMLGATNWAEFLVAFAPMPFKVPANLIVRGLVTTARVGGRVVITGLTEAGEEAVQEVFQRQALGEEIVLDDEMKAAIAIGGIMGMGLGVAGDVCSSIIYRTKDNLSPDLKAQFDKDKAAFERQGFTPEQADLKALDSVADTEEGAKVVAEATEAVKQAELLNQIKPKTDAEQVAWEHMSKDFPEAATRVEVPMNLEALRLAARLKDYTISELTVPVARMPAAKFRITGKGVRVYARDLAEVEAFLKTGALKVPPAILARMKGELAHALFEAAEGRGYFKDVAGFRGVVDKMSEAEVRDLHAMYARTGKITEPTLIGAEYTTQEIMELEGELAGQKEWISTEPAAKLRNLIKKVGWYKGEVSNLTIAQYKKLTGKAPLANILTPDKKHVRWEYALEDPATEMGYASGEDLKYAIENSNEALARIKRLEAELAKITPEMMAEAKLEENRERMLEAITAERTDEETVPRGTVRHPSQYKGMEDFTAEVNRELFYPIKESPLDMSAAVYWRRGDFDEYIRYMPDVSEMKLKALSDEVRANIAELEELRDGINKIIDSLGVEISLEKSSSEKFKAGQKEIAQLENDAHYCEDSIKKLKGGERLTVEDAVALGIALRKVKGGKLVPAIKKSGFYVTTEFAEYPNFKDVGFLSGRAMDTMTLMEAIDGGYATGMAQKYILWATERTHLAKNKFVNTYHQLCQEAFEKFGLAGNKELIRLSFDVTQQISAAEADFKTSQLLYKPAIKELVSKYSKETQSNIVEFAQWTRAFLDDLLRMQNQARVKRGQDPIEYRENYLVWVAETNIWGKLGWGQKTPSDIFRKPPMPDYIKPDAPFNARAMAREGGMRGYEMERDVHKLLFDYVRTAGKDIFNTNIIQNAKIHVAALRSMGYENSARLIEDWSSEAFAGVKPTLEKGAEGFIPRPMLRFAYIIRRNLTRAVFPLNWMWNITIQPSSIAFTVGRYGTINTMRGLEYLFVPSARAEAREAYSWIIKSRRAGKMAFQDIGAQVEKNLKWEGNIIDKAESLANVITNTMESNLTGISIRAAYHYGKSLGYTGRDLLEYASKGGAKTQSMYNYEDVPGVLRAKPVGTLFPFQTFCFQAFNYIREMNFIGKFKAGAYETISAKSAEGQATIQRRLRFFIQFFVCIMLINMVVDKTTNRKPWILQSFIPFYSNLMMGTDATNPWNWPIPVQYAMEFWNAFQVAIKYEDFRKLRKWLIRYHMIGGTQINRMLDGIEAVMKGRVEDVRGKEMFEVQPEEWLKAVLMGPYQTEGGREYIDKLTEKKGEWYEYFKIPLPKRVSIKGEINKNLAMLGQVDEEGQVYDFRDFVSDLREIRRAVGESRFDKDDSPFVKGFLEAEESRERYELYVLEHWEGLIPEEILEIGKEPAQGQRDEWRALNPEDDARLAMWGYGGRIQTQKAYDLVKQWCNELGVPLEHLSCWLPPEVIAETYFKYIDAVNEFTAGSAEARLIRLEDPEFQAWGKEAYDWKDIDTHIESLRISVKWGEMDDRYDALDPDDRPAFLEANSEYADDRRRRDAYNLGFDKQEGLIDIESRSWTILERHRIFHIIPKEDEKGGSQPSQEQLNILMDYYNMTPATRAMVENTVWAVGPGQAGIYGGLWDEVTNIIYIPPETNLPDQVIPCLLHELGEWAWRQLSDAERQAYFDAFITEAKTNKHIGELYRHFSEPIKVDRDSFSELYALVFNLLNSDEIPESLLKYYYPITKAMPRGKGENLIETYVEWYKTPRKGYADDWFLMEHKDFYDAMVKLEQLKERDFSKVPDIKYKELWIGWEDWDERYEATEDKEAFREENAEYHTLLRRREAVIKGLPDNLIETYADYYTNPKLKKPEDWKYDYWFEDDWWLMEHPEFEVAMVDLYRATNGKEGWKEAGDFSKVPSMVVFELYKTYQGLPSGTPRYDFRAKHPELDAWLVLKFGYKPIAERGEKEAEKTPWEIQQEAEKFKEKFK